MESNLLHEAMGVAEKKQGNEAEFAQAWVDGRSEVLRATSRSFPMVGSALVEAAVDQAWVELYEQAHAAPPERLLSRWKRLAYLRALNGVRDRRRHPVSAVSVEELAEISALGEGSAVAASDALRAEARVQEIVRQVSGDARCWLELVIDAPTAPPREVARTLGWDREKLKSVARRTRARLRVFVSARASGAICERRQAVMHAFAATHLAKQDSARAGRIEESTLLGRELYEQVALHIAGCEECERAWRNAQNRLLRPRVAFWPIGVCGKLGVAGGSALAAGRRALDGLDRLFRDLQMRVGLSVGRATAGGAAGTAGTAGALAGKGAAVCVGVLCATGTAALVGLPTGIIASRIAAKHHHDAVMGHQGGGRPGSAVAAIATTLGTMQSDTSSVRAGGNGQRAGVAHAISKPVTPGSLVATSSTSKVESRSSARATIASASASASRPEVSIEYATSASRPASSPSKRGPCLPGSLSC